MDPPWPLLSIDVVCRLAADAMRLPEALQRMADADPLFAFTRGNSPRDATISGRDEAHLVRALLELTGEQGIELAVGEGRVAYREALGQHATVDHVYSSLAPPRFARLKIYFSRGAAWSGQQVYFAVRGASPEAFFPAIERGLAKAAAAGLVAGHPVLDVVAAVTDVVWHDFDSTPEAFEAAAMGAFGQLRMLGAPYVVEPIMEVVVETGHRDAVMDELKARKGEVSSVSAGGGWRVTARAPLARILGFAGWLQRKTGSARLAVLYDGYGHVIAPESDPDDFAPAAARRA